MTTNKIDKNKLCSVWYCENEGVHYHHRGGCGVMFCEEHEAQDSNPNIPLYEVD